MVFTFVLWLSVSFSISVEMQKRISQPISIAMQCVANRDGIVSIATIIIQTSAHLGAF